MKSKPTSKPDAELRALALEDFKRSGLTAQDLKRLRIEVLSAAETLALIGKRARAYKIPYLDPYGTDTGFYRVRFLDSVTAKFGDKKPIRYMQAEDTKPCVYLAPGIDWAAVLADPAKELWITEGEKKAAAACKAGIPTIGLGGVWSWLSRSHGESKPLPLFDWIKWDERPTVLAFDTESTSKPKVDDALSALTGQLASRGARVTHVRLPLIRGTDKTGLDDFLVAKGVKALAKLPREGASGSSAFDWRQSMTTVQQLLDDPPAPVQYLVQDLIARAASSLLVGRPKNFKSTLAAQFGLALCGNSELMDGWTDLAKAEREQSQVELDRQKELRARIRDRLDRAVDAEMATSVDVEAAPALAQQRRDAEASLAAIDRQVAAATAKVMARDADVRGARSVVEHAADVILHAEKMALCAEIKALVTKARALAERLRDYVPDPLHTPINRLREIEPEVQAALDSLPKIDPMHTPINVLHSMTAPRPDPVAARRALMIEGHQVPSIDGEPKAA